MTKMKLPTRNKNKNNKKKNLIMHLLLLCVIITIISCYLQIVHLHSQYPIIQHPNDYNTIAHHFTKKTEVLIKSYSQQQQQQQQQYQLLPIPHVTTPKEPIITRKCETMINTSQFRQFFVVTTWQEIRRNSSSKIKIHHLFRNVNNMNV